MRFCNSRMQRRLDGVIAWLDSASQALEILVAAGRMCSALIIAFP